jgi:hypothetical protein
MLTVTFAIEGGLRETELSVEATIAFAAVGTFLCQENATARALNCIC